MVNLNRIYTRTGDDGTTSLGDFSRVPKTDSRISAIADVNEANAAIGVALSLIELGEHGQDSGDRDVALLLRQVQNDLFDIGADLCLPLAEEYKTPPLRVADGWITELEEACDKFNKDLPKLKSFVLPGGTLIAARLHVATTIVRRAERSTWAAIAEYGTETSGINQMCATYLNRLSDLLFILSRHANRAHGDVLWQPGGGRA